MKSVEWSMLALRAAAVTSVAALGALNPVDAIVRGKWVRAVDCGKGDLTATLCLPAATPAEVAALHAELPERVRGMHEAGALAVAIDLELTEVDAALAGAARGGRTIFATRADGTPPSTDFPSGTPGMATTWFYPMVLGIQATVGEPRPLAIEALVQATGQPHDGGPVDGGSLNFMPYEVPFIHWTQRDTWSTAQGRIVFVGACKADRDLTRFGRQPGVVAHSELIETLRDQRVVAQVPRLLDVAFALATFGLAAWARRRAGRYPAALVGVLAFGLAMGVSVTGAWMGLSGPLLASLLSATWRPPREG